MLKFSWYNDLAQEAVWRRKYYLCCVQGEGLSLYYKKEFVSRWSLLSCDSNSVVDNINWLVHGISRSADDINRVHRYVGQLTILVGQVGQFTGLYGLWIVWSVRVSPL